MEVVCMAFSKSFPKTIDGTPYPKWVEVFLTDAEEREAEAMCRAKSIDVMKQCIDDAQQLIEEKGFKGFKEDVLQVAKTLFEKRASHEVYWKENKAKEKFDKM